MNPASIHGAVSGIAVEDRRGITHAWRVNKVDIDRDGRFSRFDGIDQLLMVLGGPGFLRAFDVARFAGEAPLAARAPRLASCARRGA